MNSYDATLGLYIDGRLTGAEGRDTQDVRDPATGAGIAPLPLATAADLNEALAAAERGFAEWRATPPETRSAVLLRAAGLLRERSDAIACIATFEQGKPLPEAKGEIALAAAILDFHAGEAMRIHGRVLERPAGTRSMVISQPVGVVAAFCAWNFPVLNVVRKLGPAIAAGCAIIIKPSEETPGSALEVIRCFRDAGLPGNVAQCVFGVPDTVSRHLLGSPVTRKLSFTGSIPVGKHLLKIAADTVMRTTMELGGHSPVLVFDDCDVEATLDMLVANKFRNAGQACISPTRFYVQDGIYARFEEGFAKRARAIRVGAGFAADTQMGPMANARRPESISAMVEDARNAGAKVLAGGEAAGDGGFFYSPTVLSDVPLTARAMTDEPFGPLALLARFGTVDEAVEHANRLPFGLAAYCFTENARRQNLLTDALDVGMIGFNNVRLSWPDSPFGGAKESGYGSEDGPEGVAAHLLTKTVHAM